MKDRRDPLKIRSQLLTALDARLRRFHDARDASAVLDQQAMAAAGELWNTVDPSAANPVDAPVDVLTILAYLHFARYQVLPDGEDQEDLRVALGLFQALASRAPDVVPSEIRQFLGAAGREPGSNVNQLVAESTRSFGEYQRSGRPEMLAAAVTALQQAIETMEPGDQSFPGRLSNLGLFLSYSYVRTSDVADLDEAIKLTQRALAMASPEDPGLGAFYLNLSRHLLKRAAAAGDIDDYNQAVAAIRSSAGITPPGPDRAERLWELGNLVISRFLEVDDFFLFENNAALGSLGRLLASQSGPMSGEGSLDEAIQAHHEAVQQLEAADRKRGDTCLT